MKNIKRIVLINVLIILINLFFINVSFARELSGITDLRSSNNVGNTIYVWTGAGRDDINDDPEDMEMNDKRDHIYCIQHNANSENAMMIIDQYMEIRGKSATAYWYDNGLKSRTADSNYNIALAYLLGQEGDKYRKAYSMDDGISRTRQRAVHHLFDHEWKEDPSLGTNLIWSKWFHDWNAENDEALGFYNRAKNEANKDTAHLVPSASVISSTVANSAEDSIVTGPYHLTYSGSIDWVCPIDNEGHWIPGYEKVNGEWVYKTNIKFYKDAACTKEYKMTNIPSGYPFYIKNTSGKEIKQIQLQNKNGVSSWLQTDMKTVETTSNVIGPINIDYKGIIDWICPIDESDNWIPGYEEVDGKWRYKSNIAFYKDAACTQEVEMTDVKSEEDFYIKNTSGKKIKNINFKLKNNSVYCAKIWFLDREDGEDAQRLISVTDRTEYCGATIILNVKLKTGELNINKKDSITNNIITSPAEFIIKTSKGKWLSGTNGTYNYDNSNVASATVYKTNNGEISLKNLLFDTYEIFEVTAPNGYLLSKQDGYDSTNNWVNCGKFTLNGEKVTVDIKNDLILSITGYVWTEGRPDKPDDNAYDSEYTKGSDHSVRNVTVKLFKKGNENPIATTTTNENGEYEFNNIVKKKELDQYYVLFEYKDGRYTVNGSTVNIKDSNNKVRYIPVAFKNIANGSKALAEKIPTNDKDVSGIAYTYKGTSNEMINIYGLSKIGTLDDEKFKLNNINLGIKEMLEPEFSVVNNIADVYISINNYNYKYNYAGSEKTNNTDFAKDTLEGPAVKWQNSNVSHAYSKPVYPSDVIYDEKSTDKKLDVKVTYRIDITNTTTYNVKELYVENKLLLNKITDNYDKNRYTLADTNWSGENGTATMKDEYLQSIQTKNGNKGINSKETVTAYITFSVNKSAIIDILNHPDGIIENNPTEVSVEGYHEYYRDDYSWENSIKKDRQLHKTEKSIEKAEAPYLVFTIKPDGGIKERTVSGKVFKDKVTVERGNSGEVVGDGAYQDDEKGISGVKVELLGEDKSLTKLYQLDANTNSDKVVDAIVTTNENGEYNLNGVVPGKYYLRFSYGNGQYKITDLTGTPLKEGIYETKIQGSQETINARDYKSTIMNSGLVDLINNKAELWYKEDEFKTGKYSVALDDIGKRKNINASDEIKEMSADSSKISVTIENTKSDVAQEVAIANNSAILGKTLLNDPTKNIKYNFGGFYFGLIEQPNQKLDIEKVITNVKLTNAQGNMLYNGNPEVISKQGAGSVTITDLDNKKNGGSSYVRAEMVETSIYGANLELTYEVRIKNISDVNYYNETYYKYGIVDKNKEVSLIPEEVHDYLDLSLEYLEERTKEYNKADRVVYKEDSTIVVDEEEIKAQKLELNGWGRLYTNKIANRTDGRPTTDKVGIIAQRILSKDDKDMEIVSHATITKARNSGTGEDSDEEVIIIRKPKNINAYAKATFTLTPPTGAEKGIMMGYAIAGIISLVFLSLGIVIIKRKIA